MVDEEWLSSEEAAQALGINLNHLRQLQFRKKITWGKKSGRSVFYLKTHVDQLAEQRSKRAG